MPFSARGVPSKGRVSAIVWWWSMARREVDGGAHDRSRRKSCAPTCSRRDRAAHTDIRGARRISGPTAARCAAPVTAGNTARAIGVSGDYTSLGAISEARAAALHEAETRAPARWGRAVGGGLCTARC